MVYILLQISVPILKYKIISCTQSTIKVEHFVRLNRTSSATNLVPVVPYKFVKYALMLVPVILFSYQLLCPKLFRNNPPGYGSIPVHLLQVLIRLSLAPSPGHSICWQSVWARQIKTVKVAFTNYCPACTGESVTQFCFRQVQENANLYVLLNDKIYSLHESLIYVLKSASSSGASHICCERDECVARATGDEQEVCETMGPNTCWYKLVTQKWACAQATNAHEWISAVSVLLQ